MRTVLTIAGFDPSGGAGVLADIKTIAAFGCFGAAAITSITAQNTWGVAATFHQPAETLGAQLLPLLEDYEMAAVKIGMLPTTEMIELVAETISRQALPNIVIDPVLRSSSGFALIEDEAQIVLLERLLPLSDVVTPNLNEVEALLGERPTSPNEMIAAAERLSRQLSQYKPVAVLVKGGHLSDAATDVLFDGMTTHIYSTEKITTRHTHGTGCTLSSAIAALLAQGMPLSEAVQEAKEYVTQAMIHAPGIGHGAGPMNHFYRYAADKSRT